jgi:hypothetical protein
MLKKVLIIAVLLSVVGLLGCTTTNGGSSTPPASVKIVREAQITSGWSVKHMEISLESETHIILTLAAGDRVDGYFYRMSGDNVTFSISGNSLIYISAGQGVDSDRFSFTASQVQGIAYIIKLTPIKKSDQKSAQATVFFEIIYPVAGEISMPIGTK